MKITIFFFLTFSLSSFVYSQNNTVKGIIKDNNTGETLIGVPVNVKGTTLGGVSDFDGKFIIKNIPKNTITLECSFISYKTQEIEVSFADGNEKTIDFSMGKAEIKISEIQVIGKSNRESEKVLMLEQKDAVIATQSIGSQELSRKGISNAEGAVTKVSGISKQEGVKNVFVRGLSDRSNSTFLNGFPLPSEDPEYKNIALDFFSSDIIQTVYVNKVFTSDLDGDVGGANINITSKELFKNSEFQIGVSGGSNSQTYSENFKILDGVKPFGYAKKNEGPADNNLGSYAFENNLDPTESIAKINQGYSFGGGKKLLNEKLSVYITGSYDIDHNYMTGTVRETNTGGAIYIEQDYDEYETRNSHMLLANLAYKLNNHNITFNSLYLHSNKQLFGDYFGLNNSRFTSTDDEIGLMRRQQVNDNSLFVNQLLSEWNPSNRWQFKLGAAYNYVAGNEPDRRINHFSYQDALFTPIKSSGNQQRYFSELNENDLNLKLEAKHKLSDDSENKSEINFGFSGRAVRKSFEAIEYDHNVVIEQSFTEENLIIGNYFNQNNLSNNYFRQNRNVDEYNVTKFINSGFGGITYQLSDKVIAMAGLRIAYVFIEVNYDVDDGGSKGKTDINQLFYLPSFNLKYDLSQKNSLRIALSQTYTLPQDKEISPFRYIGKNYRSQGNPNLQPATNNNIDLKWDYYIGSGEVFTVNGFFKYIQNPISRVEKPSAGGFQTYDNISDYATASGVEIEFKKNLLKTTGNIVSAGINGSYIFTNIKLDTLEFTKSSAELEGSAPIIINADLTYIFKKENFTWTSAVVLNYFSDRVYTIGTSGFENIVENGVPTLDFITDFKIYKRWNLGFKAKNILNPEFVLSREPSEGDMTPIALDKFKKGVNLSIGLAYKFN